MREASRFEVILFADRLKVRGVFEKEILKHEIAGYRIDPGHDLLVLVGRNGRRLKSLERTFVADDEFELWFSDLPNLDDQDFRRAVEEAVESNATTRDSENSARIVSRAIRISRWISTLSAIAMLWFALYPRPYVPLFVVNVLIPVAALVACHVLPTLARLTSVPGWVGLELPVLSGGIALAGRTIWDGQPLEWSHILLLTAASTAVLIGIVYPLGRPRTVANALGVASVLWTYPLGVITLGNQILDRSVPVARQFELVEKEEWNSRGPRYHFTVRDISDGDAVRDYPAPERLFRSVDVGQIVMIERMPGAFGIPWWRWGRNDEPK